MNSLVAEKIRTEARHAGYDCYRMRTDIYPLARTGNTLALAVNTPDLMVFHDFTAVMPVTTAYGTLESVIVQGSIESRTYDQNGLDMEIVGRFETAPGSGVFLTLTRFRVPVLFAAINKIEVTAVMNPTGLFGGSGYILGTTVIPA